MNKFFQSRAIQASIVGGIFLLISTFISEPKAEQNTATSYNQKGGITAGKVIVGTQPRHIDEDVIQQLNYLLPKNLGQVVRISVQAGDNESFNFGTEVLSFLRQKGWGVDSVNQVFSPPLTKGISLIQNTDQRIVISIGSQ